MPRKKKLTEQIYPEILNMAEFMKFLRVSHGTATKLLTSGKIPCKHYNREWRIPKQAVIDWVQSPNEKEA
jgi:hypothetical protein